MEDRIHRLGLGGVSFADLKWKPRCLIEMKKAGTDLSRTYNQAFRYWIDAVPDRPRYVVLCLSLYFNVSQVGNASSASIPLAIHDAVRDGVIKEPMRIFAPGFGAGAVAGYSVMRIDPEVVAISEARPSETEAVDVGRTAPPNQSADNVGIAFG